MKTMMRCPDTFDIKRDQLKLENDFPENPPRDSSNHIFSGLARMPFNQPTLAGDEGAWTDARVAKDSQGHRRHDGRRCFALCTGRRITGNAQFITSYGPPL
jgi:hypothetical protein